MNSSCPDQKKTGNCSVPGYILPQIINQSRRYSLYGNVGIFVILSYFEILLLFYDKLLLTCVLFRCMMSPKPDPVSRQSSGLPDDLFAPGTGIKVGIHHSQLYFHKQKRMLDSAQSDPVFAYAKKEDSP